MSRNCCGCCALCSDKLGSWLKLFTTTESSILEQQADTSNVIFSAAITYQPDWHLIHHSNLHNLGSIWWQNFDAWHCALCVISKFWSLTKKPEVTSMMQFRCNFKTLIKTSRHFSAFIDPTKTVVSLTTAPKVCSPDPRSMLVRDFPDQWRK